MEFQLDKVLRFHLRIFQIFGYFPFSLSSSALTAVRLNYRVYFLQFWSVFLLIFYFFIFVVAFTSDDEFLFKSDLFGYFNDGMKLFFGQMAISVIFMETLQHRVAQRQFWRLYQDVHQPLYSSSGRSWWFQLRQHQRFCISFYGLYIGELISLTLFMLFQRPMLRHILLFWGIYEPYILFVRMRLLQCLLHVELLGQELRTLACDLQLLVDFTNYTCKRGVLPFRRYGEYLRMVMREQQLRYSRIYKMYACMQLAFGSSMIAVLVMIYVRVVVDTYFAYYSIYMGYYLMDANFRLPFENFMLFTSFCEIPIFLLSSKRCMFIIEELTYQLHKIKTLLPGDEPHSGFSKQLQNFSLQILHQRMRIDGFGITPLDGYVLTKALGSITIYMIFFVQFMPKFVSVPMEIVNAK